MASTRYVAGPVDVGRLGRSVLQVVGGAVVVWIWTWMDGPGHPMPCARLRETLYRIVAAPPRGLRAPDQGTASGERKNGQARAARDPPGWTP